MIKILSIAGSDCSGGAGIQADIKTITAHKMYAMSVITALTAQNTEGVSAVMEVDRDFVASQLDSVFTDIVPDAIKIGMVLNSEIIEVIAEKLEQYNAKNIVVDPVMIATSGSKLMLDTAQITLIEKLLPIASVITPNLMEGEALSGLNIVDEEDMVKACSKIYEDIKVPILLKGGHLNDSANDCLYNNSETFWYREAKIKNSNTHGTGCTLSTAIACNLASGKSLDDSIRNSKAYLTSLINAKLDLGKGRGPLEHTCLL